LFFLLKTINKFTISISRWAARAGTLRSEQEWRVWLSSPHALADEISPERVEGVNPMKLRRAGRLGNAAVAVGKELLREVPPDQSLSVLTISELGELEANDALIESVVSGTPVSPQGFAASVHDHILGQVCINLGLPCSGGASTGARSGLEIGLIEALSEMEMGHWVLALIFEPRVDEHYAPRCGGKSPEHIVGLLLRPGTGVRLELEKGGTGSGRQIDQPYALNWLALVTGHAEELEGRDGWRWRHVAG
jgi:hypothetical protein